eukprot:TRINITY_DN2378_c0_g1_i4.p1 TRINITY_DN2378_c0_g1~~TRINITY_DN2378_c0_g1_i4.p1  ORF type:complete len:186 (+),score=50.91 TRINITY_DN2378_c0_g1_i4:346-903(+)
MKQIRKDDSTKMRRLMKKKITAFDSKTKIEWRWKCDGEWKPFKELENQVIEEAFQNGDNKVSVVSSHDIQFFPNLIQVDKSDHTRTRPITRIERIPLSKRIITGDRRDTHHIFEESDELWECSLIQADIIANNNKFYKVQLMEADDMSHWIVSCQWGRVGSSRSPSHQNFTFQNFQEAQDKFKSL